MKVVKGLVEVLMLLFFSFSALAQSKYPSILWEIKKTKTSKPSYLFGTYHISSKGVFKLGDSIFTAIKAVDIIAKEVNVNTWQKEQNKYDEMQYTYESYTNQYKPIGYNVHTLKKTNTVEKLAEFIGIVPNFVNYFLYRNNAESDGFEEEIYLDKFISSAGFKYGKEVRGLENYLESNALSVEGLRDQADLEKQEKKELPGGISYKEMTDKIYDGYLNNSLDMMDSFMVYQFESEAFYNKFLVQRNYNQADSIDNYIKTGKTVFAAVGCGHLPGQKGVIEILRSKGYILRPVKLKSSGNGAFEALKIVIVPVKLTTQNVDDVIEISAPSPFYTYYKTDIFNSYGCVDMKNDAFYYIARLVNNAAYFTNNNVVNAIDSLLYSSIKGEITSKKQFDFKGYKCIDVTTKVKNKDVERYRFIVTNYEVLKFEVGGKNDYANSAAVDTFFSSIVIKDAAPLNKDLSFKFATNYNFNQWVNLNNSYLQSKQRYTNYDTKNDQLNSCIKLQLPDGEKLTDSLIMQVLRESILSSESFTKTTIDDATKMPLVLNKLNQFKLANNKMLAVKCVVNFPYIYLLSSLNKSMPDTSFIHSFELKNYAITDIYAFTDSAKGYTVNLPFKQELDARWKKQMDRKKKKYDDIKTPNDNDNLFYTSSNFGKNTETDDLLFEDKVNMEVIKMQYTTLDKELYYPTAFAFWQNLVQEYPTNNQVRNSYSYKSTRTKAYVTNKMLLDNDATTNLKNIVYDTANKHIQKLRFEVEDSINKKMYYNEYVLANGKLYQIIFVKNHTENTAFQKLFLNSFNITDSSKTIEIYQSKLNNIIAEYKTSTVQKRPNILNRLNNMQLGINDFQTIKDIYKSINNQNIDNNILRRKLIDMTAEGTYTDEQWPLVSKWLMDIFYNMNELATIRSFAAEKVIGNKKLGDADLLLKEFYNTPNAFQKRFTSEMKDYLKYVYPKNDLIQKVKLNLLDKEDIDFVSLLDSGYFTKAEKLEAFSFYKKKLEDETLNLQISQEKSELLFKEDEISETLTEAEGESNFEQLLKGFRLFYALNPKDIFFKESYEKILKSKSAEDIMGLLEILLQQSETEYDLVNEIVKQYATQPSKLYQINKLFFENKKYDKLSNKFKDKILMAKYLLLDERHYDKLDSITYLGAKKYPYNQTDSIYFFKYIEDRQSNENIAYVVIDNNNTYLEAKPFTEFTTEQITKLEPYEKLSLKLMRRYFTETYFSEKKYFYNNKNYSKNITSEE